MRLLLFLPVRDPVPIDGDNISETRELPQSAWSKLTGAVTISYRIFYIFIKNYSFSFFFTYFMVPSYVYLVHITQI